MSTSRAASWDAGVVVGSGRVGAVVWGDPAELRISLSHEHFFLPVNERPIPPDLTDARRVARRAVLEGASDRAARIVDDAVGADELVWTDPLAPCATLTLAVHGADEQDDTYRRQVDLDAGVARVEWSSLQGQVAIEVAAPRGGERVLIDLAGPAGALFEVRLGADGAPSGIRIEPACGDDRVALEVLAPGVVEDTARSAITQVTWAQGISLRTDTADGWALAKGTFSAGGRVRLVVDLAVTGAAGGRPTSAESGEHGALMRGSWLELESSVSPSVPTEELLERAGADGAYRRALVELTYVAGRYNIISSTGDLPPTLQGVWQGSWSPAWSSDYTLNGNLQNGGAASLVPTGTPQLIRSISRLLGPHLDDFCLNARRLYGFRGAMIPSRMSTHGLANHFSHDYPHEFWTGAGGWLLRMLADAVLSTGDKSLVDEGTWELAVEVMRFYRELVSEGPIAPGYSPENTPAGRQTPLAVDPTIDVAIVRDAPAAFATLAEASSTAVPPDALYEPPVPSYQVSPEGLLAEWGDARFADRIEHRHSSQLYPLWYLQDGALDERLRDAADRLVRAKIAWRASDLRPPPGNMEMAFGLVQVGLAAAALGDAESALRCVEWLACDHFTAAMTSTHDAGEIFNMDASGGLPALVAAMLVQSTRSSISLLPALPAAWPGGAVGGLTTRTGVLVEELLWDREGLVATLCATSGSEWVRRGPVEVQAPVPARLRRDGRWTEPSRSFELAPSERQELVMRWEG